MGVDYDSRCLAEPCSGDHVRGLPGNSRQREQLIHAGGNAPLVLGDDALRGTLEGFGLVAEEASRVNEVFQALDRGRGDRFDRGIRSEEVRRDLIHPLVGALCREDRRHEQFPSAGMLQRALGVRIVLI